MRLIALVKGAFGIIAYVTLEPAQKAGHAEAGGHARARLKQEPVLIPQDVILLQGQNLKTALVWKAGHAEAGGHAQAGLRLGHAQMNTLAEQLQVSLQCLKPALFRQALQILVTVNQTRKFLLQQK